MRNQLQIFENQTERDLEIYIEMNPDRYVLKPGDRLELTFDHEGNGYGMHTNICEDSLQIYIHHFDTATVKINGVSVEPWSQ